MCALIGPRVERFRWQKEPGSDVRLPVAAIPLHTMYMLADGPGIPVLKRETAGRKGKGPDGEAKTREMKLGCVFTPTRPDENGYPVRDEASTSDVGSCENARVFAHRLVHESRVRGLDMARRVCIIGDGAP